MSNGDETSGAIASGGQSQAQPQPEKAPPHQQRQQQQCQQPQQPTVPRPQEVSATAQPPSTYQLPAPNMNATHAAVVGDSVVTHLMQIYEDMTQTKNPVAASAPAATNTTQPTYTRCQNPVATAAQVAQFTYNQTPAPYYVPVAAAPAPTNAPIPVGIKTPAPIAPAPSDQQDTATEAAPASGRALRKRSVEKATESTKPSKTRKKGNNTDNRWSKRFSWPEHLHRDFVSAIFDVGLKHSSPSAILENMPRHEQITSERIKSHLQKYRLHRAKSKKEFMTSYNDSLQKFQSSGIANIKTLSSGEVAAHMAYASMTGVDSTSSSKDESDRDTDAALAQPKPTQEQHQHQQLQPARTQQHQPSNGALLLPRLTEEEKQSPIGVSLGYLVGLFFSLRQQLMTRREENATREPVSQALGTTFVQNGYGHGSGGGGGGGVTWAPGIETGKPPPSTRTNLEANNVMKQEMQNQKAVQNKMRAMKQQEVDKCSNVVDIQESQQEQLDLTPNPVTVKQEANGMTKDPSLFNQGAGEAAQDADSTKLRPHGVSAGSTEVFWNTDVVDEQIFEFLMNS